MAKGTKSKILVFGSKKVGKSNFIHQINQYEWRVSLGNYSVHFDEMRPLDGLNHESICAEENLRVSPAHVLYELAEKLKHNFKSSKSIVHGCILVHHVTDEPVTQHDIDGWNLLFDILGTGNLSHLTIVTMKWCKVDPEAGWKREQELMEHWKPALENGARLRRCYGFESRDDSRSGAVAIAEEIVGQGNTMPQFAEELCVEKRKLADTTAGVSVLERMRLRVQSQEEEKWEVARTAGRASADGRLDDYDKGVEEIKAICIWRDKLTQGIECMEGKQRFKEPWYKQGGGGGGSLGLLALGLSF